MKLFLGFIGIKEDIKGSLSICFSCFNVCFSKKILEV